LEAMATYEYVCLACEHPFEQRRAMSAADTSAGAATDTGASTDTGAATDTAVGSALTCPSCGSNRVRRRFSLFATGSSSGATAPSTGGCACGGACACGGH
jgi:DNA-directed RNA polymerase subunit RPC12/RpoP